jgi:hypothetical protein
MREMLMTVSVLDWDESGAKETPAIVVNWDEGEDGDIETLGDSSLFLLAYGTSREDIEIQSGAGIQRSRQEGMAGSAINIFVAAIRRKREDALASGP